MKLNTTCLLGLTSLALALPLSAATAFVSNVTDGVSDTIYANSSGTLLSGGIVTLGYFGDGYDVNANLANTTDLIANFTVLTSAISGAISDSLGGAFAGFAEQSGMPTSIGTITGADPLIGRGLYSFIGDAATLGGSSEFALLFTQNIADDNPFPQAYTSDPSGITPLIGTLGTFIGDASGQGSATHTTVQLAAVPEPSALLLSAFGVLGLLRRKR